MTSTFMGYTHSKNFVISFFYAVGFYNHVGILHPSNHSKRCVCVCVCVYVYVCVCMCVCVCVCEVKVKKTMYRP
jgi:hypothetical protein